MIPCQATGTSNGNNYRENKEGEKIGLLCGEYDFEQNVCMHKQSGVEVRAISSRG